MHMVIMADSNYKDMFTYLAQHGGNVNACASFRSFTSFLRIILLIFSGSTRFSAHL